MSKKGLEAVIGKALLDIKFRNALLANPEKALAGFDLTKDEIASLKSMDGESLDFLANTLDQRVSKTTLMTGISSGGGGEDFDVGNDSGHGGGHGGGNDFDPGNSSGHGGGHGGGNDFDPGNSSGHGGGHGGGNDFDPGNSSGHGGGGEDFDVGNSSGHGGGKGN